MVRFSTQYVCQQCGYSSPKWLGQCPECSTWNSMVETVVLRDKKQKAQNINRSSVVSLQSSQPVKLSQITKSEYGKRISSGIEEFDRVLGGGIVSGMVTLIAGEPGIGKSTLLLQVAEKIGSRQQALGNRGEKLMPNDLVPSASVIYIAGEESASQIANRAGRLGIKGENIEIIENTDVDEVIEQVTKLLSYSDTKDNSVTQYLNNSIALIIVDSIQTLTTSDLTGTAGSVGQVRECASRITTWAKRNHVPVFLVGHVTREGTIAGPRVLEHMVDTVVWFEGERREFLRLIRAIKNRFGPTDEVGIFSMEEKGLVATDPTKLMLDHTGVVSGSCLAVLVEGTRPLIVEIQALVAPTKLAFPKRSASGVDSRRLELIIAVLSRRVGIPLWEYDVYVNVAGGLKVADPASDLAIALAIASAFKEVPVKGKLVAVGEIGLLGEVREVVQLARRLKEAQRLGFKTTVSSKLVKTVAEAVHKYVK